MTGLCSHILGIILSQLTNSYFSEGWLNHQPVTDENVVVDLTDGENSLEGDE